MYTALKKIQKDKDVEPTEFEELVAQASTSIIGPLVYVNLCIEILVIVVYPRHSLTWRMGIRSWRAIWKTFT